MQSIVRIAKERPQSNCDQAEALVIDYCLNYITEKPSPIVVDYFTFFARRH